MDKKDVTRRIKEKARALGFMGIAVARAEHMDEEANRLEQRLNQNYHGEMSYLENHINFSNTIVINTNHITVITGV